MDKTIKPTTVRSSACSSWHLRRTRYHSHFQIPSSDTQFICPRGPAPVLLVWSCPSCWCGPVPVAGVVLVSSQSWCGLWWLVPSTSPAGHIPVPILLVWSCPSCWCGPGILPVLMWTLVTGPVHQSCWSHPSSYPAGMVPVLLVTSQFLSCWNGPIPDAVPFPSHRLVPQYPGHHMLVTHPVTRLARCCLTSVVFSYIRTCISPQWNNCNRFKQCFIHTPAFSWRVGRLKLSLKW